MKNIIRKIAAWLIARGADKWLHFLFALVIAALVVAFVPFLLGDFAGVVFLSVFVPCALDAVKESCIDDAPDIWDMVWTLAGALAGMGLSLLILKMSALW